MNKQRTPENAAQPVRTFPGRRWRRPRRGITIAETIAAVALLAIAITVSMRVVGWIASERRTVERQTWALQEATNALEALRARPVAELTADAVRANPPVLSDDSRTTLPGGQLLVSIREQTGSPAARWIQVTVLWKDASGGSVASIRLSTWVHPREEQPRP